MTKIYEALEQAQRERFPALVSAEKPSAVQRYEAAAHPVPTDTLDGVLVNLYQAVHHALGQAAAPAITFVAHGRSAGASVLLSKMAQVVAHQLKQNVLYVSTGAGRRAKPMFNIREQARSLLELLDDSVQIEDVVQEVGSGHLCVTKLSNESGHGGVPFIASDDFEHLLNRLRSRFDLILVEGADISEHPEGLTLLDKLDGVVLVLESESTRVHAAEALMRTVQMQGGRVLGTVLNRRRHHIPGFLYNRI